MNAIEAADLTKRFGTTVAVNGVSLEVETGNVVAVLGPNGAGKTTLVNLLLGLQQPDEGSIRVLGCSPAAAARQGRLGAMLQTGRLRDLCTVERLVDLFASLYPRPLPVGDALDRAGVADLAGKRTDQLSGGQAQRVRFALAIVGNPSLVFLDEPTSAMDIAARRAFWATMRDWCADGRTVVFASHHLDEVEAVADRIIVLRQGQVVADGNAASLRRNAGTSAIRFVLDRPTRHRLDRLPGVTDAHVGDGAVTLRTTDSDATVAALYAAGLRPRGLEISHTPLDEVFLELTEA